MNTSKERRPIASNQVRIDPATQPEVLVHASDELREANQNLIDAIRQRDSIKRDKRQAETAVQEAGDVDRRNLANAMRDGKKEPSDKETEKAAKNLAEVERRLAAAEVVVRDRQGEVKDAAAACREDWIAAATEDALRLQAEAADALVAAREAAHAYEIACATVACIHEMKVENEGFRGALFRLRVTDRDGRVHDETLRQTLARIKFVKSTASDWDSIVAATAQSDPRILPPAATFAPDQTGNSFRMVQPGRNLGTMIVRR